jgi:hypothetical protein
LKPLQLIYRGTFSNKAVLIEKKFFKIVPADLAIYILHWRNSYHAHCTFSTGCKFR